MKKLISCFLALAVLLGCSAFAEEETPAGNPVRYEGAGFDTPEDAVTCYMHGLKNLDFEQMLSAYAWETLASHYDTEKAIEYQKSYSPVTLGRMPSFNGFMQTANLHAFRANETRMIYDALEAYIMGDEFHQGFTLPVNEDEAEDFLQQFDNGKLEQLSGMGEILFLTPDVATKGVFSLEKNQENFAKQTARYGADEVVNVVAAAPVGNGMLVCVPTVARYGDRWYMVSVISFTAYMLAVESKHMAFFWTEGFLSEDSFR